MLSTTCKYAVRAIIFIGLKGSEDNRANARVIASELGIPMQFLSKILQIFVRKGLLNSFKGPTGGFFLAKKAEEITLLDIVEIIDGPSVFESCLIGTGLCHSSSGKAERCPVHDRYSKVRKEVVDYFSSETIGGIIERMGHDENVLLKL
ncbi:Rrf2 family transcriptional regulator [Marinilabilia salmonicolor]|jgi:Rrf2 family protein|uniref:BadM/Rrf2 family transcriptional regulator n=1 Tax=Marinilabilia salmonicolor TaxID=989 RepID=A0A2T0XRB9_9BACT|nr:Rrf2 family transcriptional regulator [Marinilabilia salmonicolor]PRZ01467.1 BadM/Rrf2 family transcriptional regulator [Marinilabilia salmonicolor]RCW32001.1 BadM/Rrf2 family transcriptional regulator [Marinilabilia salmonicolor]